MAGEVRILGLSGIPEVRKGDDPIELIVSGLEQSGLTLEQGDIVVVTHKLVSKAEGRVVELDKVTASDLATRWAEAHDKDPRHVEVVFQEAARIVRMDRGLIIAETRHGFVCANAGVDASNVAGHKAVSMLPIDPDASARQIRSGLEARVGFAPAVIITDSFGRPWRRGIINIAIGSAGINPLLDYRGQFDDQGYEMHATVMAIADEIASAAELVMNKLDRCPVAIVRGYPYEPSDIGAAETMVMSHERDLFR
jgi:coenzyme F420-0:L-glutamate ligase/coenzyme F420-1:gamma-L-glutamate ligase